MIKLGRKLRLLAALSCAAIASYTANATLVSAGPTEWVLSAINNETGYQSYSGSVPSYMTVEIFATANKDYGYPYSAWAKASTDLYGTPYVASVNLIGYTTYDADWATFSGGVTYGGFTLEVYRSHASGGATAGIYWY